VILSGQTTDNDSLLYQLSRAKSDSLKAALILDIRFNDPEESLEKSRYALDVFTNLNIPLGKAGALNKMGFSYWNMGDFNQAITYFEKALQIARTEKDSSWIARTTNNLGAVHWGLSNYNTALELFQNALEIRTSMGYKRGMSLISNNIGLIYQVWKLYDEAMAYHNRALLIAREIDDASVQAYSYHNLGTCYEAKKEYDQALDYYQKAYSGYMEAGEQGGATSLALRSIGDIYFIRKDLKRALTYYQKALSDANLFNNVFRMAYAQHSLGKTFAEAARFDSARYYINASLNTSREMGYEDVTRDNYYVLSRLEEESGNLDKALDYFKIAASVNDSIFNKEKIAKFTELQIRYNMEKQNQENELLRQKNEIQSLQIRRDRIIRISLIAGSVFVLIILFLIYYQSRMLQRTNTALERQNAEILKMNEEKEDLIRRLEKENEERRRAEKRIAMLLQDKELLLKEVHHRIKNNMNTMKSLLSLQAKTIEDAKAAEVLKDAGSRIQSMGLLYDKIYRSENIRALSAREYIPQLVEEIVAVFPNCEKVQIETEIEDVTLPVDILSPLGIITTELVTNAMKYGFEEVEKGHLQLRFRRMDGKVKYEIRNNGQALPEDFSIEDSRGFGLRLVNMLVQQLDGKIHTGKGRETCFMITFPLFN